LIEKKKKKEMLLNPNSDYFYNCNNLPNVSSPFTDQDRAVLIARNFPFFQSINENIIQVFTPNRELLTIKILPWQSDQSHEEYRKYCQMSLISNKTLLFPNVLGWFDYVGLPFHWKMQMQGLSEEKDLILASKPNKNDKRKLFIVYESIGLRFEGGKEGKDILFLILHGLYLGRKFYNFTHNSLKSEDFMLREMKGDGEELDFNVEDKRYILENVKYVPVIVDLGYESCTLNKIRRSTDLKDIQRILPMHAELYKTSAWQTSLNSNSNDYRAITRIFETDYFKSFKREDNMIRPPIGAGTFNRVYKTFNQKSVIRFGIVEPSKMPERTKMFNHSQGVLIRLFEQSPKFGPSLFRQIRPGRWVLPGKEDFLANDITVIDLQDKGKNMIYAHEIEYLDGDTLATDLFPTSEGCFSLVWFLYAGYYSNLRHRDIKGENCVIRTYKKKRTFTFQSNNYFYNITTDRIPVFIDFDVSSLDDESDFRDKTGSLYTCPPGLLIARFVGEEQYDDKTYDWWSLGVTLFGWFTWNALTDFQQYANIVDNYFRRLNASRKKAFIEEQKKKKALKLEKERLGLVKKGEEEEEEEEEFQELRPDMSQQVIIATLIFYCHINYVIAGKEEGEASIYGFLDPIYQEIIDNLKESKQVEMAFMRYQKAPVGVKTLIRKFLSNDIEGRVEDMEDTIYQCFSEFGEEKDINTSYDSDYTFEEEESMVIDFSPKKSPLPAFKELDTSFGLDNFSPKKLKLQEDTTTTDSYVYMKKDFVDTIF
jgi:serine/threonine protein kinase